MSHLRLASLAFLLLSRIALGESPATRPTGDPVNGYRLLGNGSWIVSEAMVRTTPGFPGHVKRKVTIADAPGAGQRTIREFAWSGSAFEPTGPEQNLATPDTRSFDQMNFTAQGTPADMVMTIARKRYPCTATVYHFENKAKQETTRLTLYRDKSQQVRLPLRYMGVAGQQIPLPEDAIGADLVIEGHNTSIKGQRRIVSLASPVAIKDRTCMCVIESIRQEGQRGAKPLSIMGREWHCHELPGEKLKSESITTMGQVRIESDVVVQDFFVTPAAIAKAPATRPWAE